MHTCVHAWAMHVLNADWDISMARLALDCVGSAVPTDDVSEYWAIGRRLLPHSRRYLESTHRLIDVQPPDNPNIYRALYSLGYLYSDQGKMQEAEDIYRRALEGKEKACGPEHTSTLDTVNNLGNLYKSQSKMQEAEVMYRRALEGFEKAWGPEHGQQPGKPLYRSTKDAGSRGHVSAGAGMQREGVGSRAHVDAGHSQQPGKSL